MTVSLEEQIAMVEREWRTSKYWAEKEDAIDEWKRAAETWSAALVSLHQIQARTEELRECRIALTEAARERKRLYATLQARTTALEDCADRLEQAAGLADFWAGDGVDFQNAAQRARKALEER